MQGKTFSLVRSVVADPNDRHSFDHWHQTDHIPLIFFKIGNVVQAWRFWSQSDPTVHYSLSEFADASAFQQAASSDGFKDIVADFDRAWGERVARTRDVLGAVQHHHR